MRIISLQKLVEENGITLVKVIIDDAVVDSFTVGSTEYETKKTWLVKGEFRIEPDSSSLEKILICSRLEDGINVSINKPEITTDDAEFEAKKQEVEDMINLDERVVVFHRSTLLSSSRNTKRRFALAYAEACIESFVKANPDATRADFALFRIDFANKTVHLESIPEAEEKKEEESTG